MSSEASILRSPEQEVSLTLEIHFQGQELASVLLESNASGPEGNFAEVLLFTLFAVRQFTILGKAESRALAAALQSANSSMTDLAGGYELGDVKIEAYRGNQGEKVLFGRFILRNESHTFHCNTKGFGFLSRGIGYYSPTAVFVLLRYLAMQHASENEYLSKLGQAAQLCGTLYLQGKIRMTNQSEVAFTIAATVLDGTDRQDRAERDAEDI